jgi:hypothetical protein
MNFCNALLVAPIDFTKLGQVGRSGGLIPPREIFNALPSRDPSIEYLRDGQGQVLEKWFERRDEKDLVIKMNTGGGKTVAGLLILQSCLNEGKGPALYVAPDNFLVAQVALEASRLGLGCTTDVEDGSYARCEKVGIINVFKLINSRSVFGGPSSMRQSPLEVGSILIDDAHAALATTEEQFALRMEISSPVAQEILQILRPDLTSYAPAQVRAVDAADPAVPPLEVPAWMWQQHIERIMDRLNARRTESPLDWNYPLIEGCISLCTAIVSSRWIEIAPPCVPIDVVAGFARAHRRIFLTATLADDGVLIAAFDADPRSVSMPITPESAGDMGDRLILAPQEITPGIMEDEIKGALKSLSEDVNVVVIVPSRRRADYWADVARAVADATEIDAVVQELREHHVGLVVLVNKYDGVDLPGPSCRVLVLDGLPEVTSLAQLRMATVLSNSAVANRRQMQRIEQGMGRGVRGANDWCVVLLLGSKLTDRLANHRLSRQLSSVTRAQLELFRNVARAVEGTGMQELVEVIKQSLDRDPAWIEVSKAAVAAERYDAGHVEPTIVAQRQAFQAAQIGQTGRAADVLQQAVDDVDNDDEKGWLLQQRAGYVNTFDAAESQVILAAAVRRNNRVCRPMAGVVLPRSTSVRAQGQLAASYLESRFAFPNELIVGLAALEADLAFDPDRTNLFENAVEELGQWLGLNTERPERDTGNGPDVLWRTAVNAFIVIECKSGSRAPEIYRSDVAQLAHSMSWFEEEVGGSAAAKPLLIHPSSTLAGDATQPQATRVMTTSERDSVLARLGAMVRGLAASGRWRDPEAVAAQIAANNLAAPGLFMTLGSLLQGQ